MPRFGGTHTDTFTVPHSIEVAKKHFGSLSAIVAASSDVESATEDGDTIHFLLKPQNLAVTQFQGRYSCRYFFADDNSLVWEPVGEGNAFQSGKATFSSTSDGQTQIEYSETIEMEMDLPALMAPMLKPVIAHVVIDEMKNYLKRMIDSLPA